MTQPVLLLLFNRPDLTRRVFEEVRAARPERLYIAADGPRPGHPTDLDRCEQAREIVNAVDWPCRVETLFRDANLGCRRAVSEAITWFFDREECGIILEDDCLPDPSWFRFASEMLHRYREEERVICVSASHFHGDQHRPEASYFFSIFNHCWGWASWRRAWSFYDDNMASWPQLRESGWLRQVRDSRRFEHYWTEVFDQVYRDQIDSWAYRWTYSAWLGAGLTILPSHNLVKNIGFGDAATHTSGTRTVRGGDTLESIAFPLTHPERIEIDHEADAWTSRHHFGITRGADLRRRVKRAPVLGRFARYVSRLGKGTSEAG